MAQKILIVEDNDNNLSLFKFDGYLSKPVNTRELPGLVEKWLNGEQ